MHQHVVELLIRDGMSECCVAAIDLVEVICLEFCEFWNGLREIQTETEIGNDFFLNCVLKVCRVLEL